MQLITGRTEAASAEALRQAADHLRDTLGSGVVVLGTVIDGKPNLVAMATPDAVQRGLHAGKLLKTLAPLIGGGGGGRPDMAQAGGRDPDKLDAALAAAPQAIEDVLGAATAGGIGQGGKMRQVGLDSMLARTRRPRRCWSG